MSKPRFGPEREAAVSLDSLGDLPEAEPEFHLTVDWDRAAQVAGLTLAEACALFHWRAGVPVSHLHRQLHCTPAQARRRFDTALRKIRAAKAVISAAISLAPLRDSLHPAYRERLPSGARPWSLAGLDATFAQTMSREKRELYSQRTQSVTRTISKSPVFYPRMLGAKMMGSKVESIDLAAELAKAERESSAISATYRELDKAEIGLRAEFWRNSQKDKPRVEAAVDEAKRAQIQRAVEAILAGQEPDPAILGMESVEARIAAVRRKREILRPALMQAAQRAAALRAKQQAATDARVYAQVKPEIAEALRLADELAEFVRAKIFEPLREVSSIEPASLFPDDIPADQRVMLFSALGSLVRVQDAEMVGGPRALLLRRRRGLNDNGTPKAAAA